MAKKIVVAIGLSHSNMKIVQSVASKLGLKVKYFCDIEDYIETEENKLFKVPFIMRRAILLKLNELTENYIKSQRKKNVDKLKDNLESEVSAAVQFEKAITLLHALAKKKAIILSLYDDQGNERKVKLTVESA